MQQSALFLTVCFKAMRYIQDPQGGTNREWFGLPEYSIVIATHSVIYPMMSFGLLDDFTPHMSEISRPTSLEDFGNCDQNPSVDVCEVSFNLHSLQRGMSPFSLFGAAYNSTN